MPNPRNLLWLFACLPACGGGGSEATVTPALQLSLAGLTLPPAAAQGTVLVQVAIPPGSQPTLLECDVVVAPPLVRALPAGALQAAQPLPTLDGQETQAGFHVLCGDAQNPDARPLAGGALFRLVVEAASPRTPGEALVSLRNLRVVDAAGNAVPVDGAPAPARDEVQ
jgi:hypothetical protein